MISGFDYGTSNCAIGVMDQTTDKAQLLPLEGDQVFLPSSLYALGRELICESVVKSIPSGSDQDSYRQSRAANLNLAARFRAQESISTDEQSLYFGREAFSEYFALPGEGYFVKSVKSFLGVSGLRVQYIDFFEDIVTAMMVHIKTRAEQHSQTELSHTVIGKPVNFQGANAQLSNIQALKILEVSAKRAGFKSVEFLYEPIAAGVDFEKQLTADKKVLVVDIGGGTTDCAMVCMGPNHRDNVDRRMDFIGHAGERIGGNDFDIQMAAKILLPVFGMGSMLKSGLPMPTQMFWDAVSTNDVGAQQAFNKLETSLALDRLLIETTEPKLLQRFVHMRDNRQNQQLVRLAEQAKIELSSHEQTQVALDFIERELSCSASIEQLRAALHRPLNKMMKLMDETIAQAAVTPDLIYITGGSAKSPLVRQAIEQKIGNIPVVDGDHFGSVANGLTLWADKIYR
ncbi:MAG: molecular chaperone [Oceanospirillaceae bacterium]|nr:molecular chaperone [Oceanospirillaceae bacterium]